ncbi:hypothetical protein FOMPIDRAFT_1056341 [Fomitopsis schrenkii]|uniref:Uncharacterized protein n=1 Tax=Fomitopsis schrenkii TaxID=2126942 RepID=S8DHK9_FOMSC|nr:hypothetical protein FOMPIDRAFT_1056341 [Fomitopsis schrenkii]
MPRTPVMHTTASPRWHPYPLASRLAWYRRRGSRASYYAYPPWIISLFDVIGYPED